MNRFFTRLFAGCLLAAAWQIAAAAPQAPGTSSDELLRAAFEILHKADTDQLGELWESGSGVLKSRMSKTSFIQATRKARLSMGPVATRDWVSVTRLKYQTGDESGFPAGLYANVEWATRLGSGRNASERISFALVNNNWQFTGYAIAREAASPAAPDTSATPATPAVQPSPSLPPPASNAGAAEVEAAVRAWATAWSAQDVDRYLATYAPEFAPAGSQSRKSWEEERRARIAGKSSISVTLDNLAVSIDGQSASARFRQTYRSDKLSNVSRKTLELQRSGNQWLIRKESTGG